MHCMLTRVAMLLAWLRALILMLPLVYGLHLAWQEIQFRQGLAALPTAAQVPDEPIARPQPLNMLAVATVLGLSPQDNVVSSNEPWTLLATVVGSDSRALLAGPAGERFYRAGEQLSHSSVLRRIEPAHVVLWRQGREERLMLRPAGTRFLRSVDTPRQAATSLYLKPVAEPSRSE